MPKTPSLLRRGPFVFTVTVPDTVKTEDLETLRFQIGQLMHLCALSIHDHADGTGVVLGISFQEGDPPQPWRPGALVEWKDTH